MRAIGSVLPFPLTEIGGGREESLWGRWTAGFRHHSTFQTARGALRALLEHERVRRLWLPAYICGETASAAPEGCELRFYRDAPGHAFGALEPMPGDAVLGVDYFGRSASPGLRRMAAERRDVLWIEDRAQAMAPDRPPWGAVLLYSPRKLIGVADGGLLVSDRPLPPPPAFESDLTAWTAALARWDDPDGARPALWRDPFRAREAAFDAEPLGMQGLTRALLERIALNPLAEQRKANYACLSQRLQPFALWPDRDPAFAPLCFPIRVRDAAATVAWMAERGVFCPRHWADLPSAAAAAFPEARALSASLLSIPCDHRYEAADMERAATTLIASADPL